MGEMRPLCAEFSLSPREKGTLSAQSSLSDIHTLRYTQAACCTYTLRYTHTERHVGRDTPTNTPREAYREVYLRIPSGRHIGRVIPQDTLREAYREFNPCILTQGGI